MYTKKAIGYISNSIQQLTGMPFSYSEIPNNSPYSSLFLHSYLLSPNSIIVMKFKFKIQQCQTEAVENTVNVFAGQPAQQGQKGYRLSACLLP